MENDAAIPESEGPAPDGQMPDGPLNEHHYQQLALASDLAKPIHRAARVASFNGWTTAIIAALSLPFAASGWVALLVAVGLFIVAFFELRGRKQLLKFNPQAASQLGWNQIGLLTLVLVYCCWMLFGGASDIDANPELSQMLGAAGREMYRTMVVAVYGTVIAVSLIVQGGNAAYYFTRRKCIDTYLKQTPQWVRDFQKATAGK